MRRKRNDRMRFVIVSGRYGVRSGRNVTDDLKTLKALLHLKKKGLAITGNVVSLCRIKCSKALHETIKDRSEKGKGILILSEKDAGEKTVKKGLKKVYVPMVELVAATCSDGLFFLIDEKTEELTILTAGEETAFMEEMEQGNI